MTLDVKAFIDELAVKYRYRPLPKKVRGDVLQLYRDNLNGFERKRTAFAQGVLICSDYERVVVGDYGAYLEFTEEQLQVSLTVPHNQRWRLDEEYIREKELSLKYIWYEFNGIKVYHQLDTVKYADYKPNRYYVSVLDFDEVKEEMAGPAKATQGEVIRPKFNFWSLFDHALGSYVKGEDGLYYLNGGWSHIMAWAGRGNTFKTFVIDQAHATIATRYDFEWWSKYDTEVSAELSRAETALRAAYRNNHWDYDPNIHSLEAQIAEQRFNFNAADTLQGQEWWGTYVRDEVEGRHKEYIAGKNLRETPFPDPIRNRNRFLLNPWLYALDSLSEFHTKAVEEDRDDSDIGDGEQNSLAMKDAKDKSDMMGRWPGALARGHFYIGFTIHLSDSIQMGRYAPDKKLDDLKANIKFSGVPARAITFLTNSLLVATASGEMVEDKSYDSTRGVTAPMYPRADARGRLAAVNDLKIIRYTQFRAKSGPTGVKFDMIFSQEEGLLVGLSEFHYLRAVLKGNYGLNRSGAYYSLPIYPDKKYVRTTIRSEIDNDVKLKRALEITAAVAYMQNNWLTLDDNLRISAEELHDKIVEKGFDWNEILENTVEWWYFKDQEKKVGKHTLTAMSLLHMAVYDLKPKFLTCKK